MSTIQLLRTYVPTPLYPPVAWAGARFYLTHAVIPFTLIAIALCANFVWGLDQTVADALFAWEGHAWSLREAFITEHLMHRGGRDFSLLAWFIVVGFWAWSLHDARNAQWRRPLGYLAVSLVLSTTLVAWIKSWSNMDCPWDLLRYGGTHPFIGLLDVRPIGMARARCFPAAQASVGYCWLALYFFLGVVRPRLRWIGLLVGLGLGLLFGGAQQLRGAHFISHDLWSLAICWAVALMMFRLVWPKQVLTPSGHDVGGAK